MKRVRFRRKFFYKDKSEEVRRRARQAGSDPGRQGEIERRRAFRGQFKDENGHYRKDGSLERHVLQLFVDHDMTQKAIVEQTGLPLERVRQTLQAYGSLEELRESLAEAQWQADMWVGTRESLERRIERIEGWRSGTSRGPSYLRLVVDNSHGQTIDDDDGQPDIKPSA